MASPAEDRSGSSGIPFGRDMQLAGSNAKRGMETAADRSGEEFQGATD